MNNWQYYFLKSLSRLVCLLPYTVLLQVGDKLGRLYYRIAVRQRLRAEQQIQESLAVSAAEAQKLIQGLFRNLGKVFLEVLYMPALTKKNIDRFVTIENREYLDEALAEQRGVVLLTAHIDNWEWLGGALALNGYPIAGVAKRQPNDQHTRVLNEFRQLVGLEVFSRGTTELVAAAKALKKGKILGFLADQDAGVNGVFVEFLGKMASTPLGPAVFAKKFKSPIVPIFIVRCPAGGHRVLVHPALRYPDDDSEEAQYDITTQMTKIIEDMVKQYPDQWMWFQKRWNTPYEEAPSPAPTVVSANTQQAGEQA